jgi:hypothetical protein
MLGRHVRFQPSLTHPCQESLVARPAGGIGGGLAVFGGSSMVGFIRAIFQSVFRFSNSRSSPALRLRATACAATR